MSRIRYVPKRQGLEEVLRSGETQRFVRTQGDAVASRAGDGFVASYRQGRSRFRGIIYADTWSAKHRDHRENVLVRTLG